MTKRRLTLGGLETVSIPDLNVHNILAKVDTGAFSGALHCTDIREEKGMLHFTPLGDPSLSTCTSEFEENHIRGATGHRVKRFTIPVIIEIHGKKYNTKVGLSDRTVMRREMLLGRRFMLENDAIVDVSLSREIDDEAKKFLEE